MVEGDGGEGSLIEAVTAVGPAALRDEMRVMRLDPPYEIQVVHPGRGAARARAYAVYAAGNDRTQVVWHEWFHLPGGLAGPGGAAGCCGRVPRPGLTQALRRFARLVEAGRLP